MSDNDVLYSLWLSCVCGHSPSLISKCTQLGKPKDIFSGKVNDAALRRVLGDSAYKALCFKDLSGAEEILDYCKSSGIRVLSLDDKCYPNMLRNINTPPIVLYTKGEELDLNDFLTVTIVGTRHNSEAGTAFTHKLGYELAAKGIIIVSGMAKGLDSAAHIGALAAKQKTVAVLAGDVENIYPKKNKELYKAILNNGMIVSERPPHTVGKGDFYRERNRIIAGLSYGTVVVEGGVRSGTSITAGFAYEFNRDIFAVPGSPAKNNSFVPNSLLRDGAVLTLSANDVLNEYSGVYTELLENGRNMLDGSPKDFADAADEFKKFGVDIEAPAKKSGAVNARGTKYKIKQNEMTSKADDSAIKSKLKFEKYSKDEMLVIECLTKHNGLMYIDEIISDTGISSSIINSILVMLQMKGAVRQVSGNLYKFVI